jgi:hypothetical protein
MVRDRFCLTGWSLAILPATSLAVLATPMVSAEALLPIAGLLILATWLRRMSTAADENKLAA